MIQVDQQVLEAAAGWLRTGRCVHLVTVLQTWGSSPRPAGSLWALAQDGVQDSVHAGAPNSAQAGAMEIARGGAGEETAHGLAVDARGGPSIAVQAGSSVGSVSGGCLEDELRRHLRARGRLPRPEVLRYGVTAAEAQRFGLPCGGRLELLAESLSDPEPLEQILATLAARGRVARQVSLADGVVSLAPAGRDAAELRLEEGAVVRVFGPQRRLLLVGDGLIARLIAEMALALGDEVILCDPRIQDPAGWSVAGVRLETCMPDDAVRAQACDPLSAVMTLAHDPRLDDLALLEALNAETGYIGALGSRASHAQRRERLASLGVSGERLARLRGPLGLAIGGRTPAEIAVSAIAELIAVRNGSLLAQRDPPRPIDLER
jgi:xanthine dehydrogenase accessory factor